MAQPQPQLPPRAFSPPQPTPSPQPNTTSTFAPPIAKRPAAPPRIMSPGPLTQPNSPFVTSSYIGSPGTATPSVPSPAAHGQSSGSTTPYTNNHQLSTPNISLPDSRPLTTPPVANSPQLPNNHNTVAVTSHAAGTTFAANSPQLPTTTTTTTTSTTPYINSPQLPTTLNTSFAHSPHLTQANSPQISHHMNAHYTSAVMAAVPPSPASQPPATPNFNTNVMGPPQKPPAKKYEYDISDSLAGTDIDLNEEEQFMLNDLGPRTGFAQYPAGNKASFYGAGIANQPAEAIDAESQAEVEARIAEQAWHESAARLAISRIQELNNPFLLVPMMHVKAEKIAREYGLSLNVDPKQGTNMGRMAAAHEFKEPEVKVKSRVGPDSVVVQTFGSFVPHDAQLVDQLALLSIATRQRVRTLVGDADRIAKNRQMTSNGDVPEDWAIAAAPLYGGESGDGKHGAGKDGATSTPRASSLKRPSETSLAGEPSAKVSKVASSMATTMRDLGKAEREWEEARLRRRNKTKEGTTGEAAATAGTSASGPATSSRAGSVPPGTPGLVAPDGEKGDNKPLTKKEIKKTQMSHRVEATHASQNSTSNMFLGLGKTSSLFGKNRGKGKTYDWMNIGKGAGSGANTPGGTGSGGRFGPSAGSKADGGAAGSPAPGPQALTVEGRNRLGTLREKEGKGQNIQMRDFVMVLEADGVEVLALQKAYTILDDSAK